MLPRKTVFVIGAGSGFDIEMPLGADLLGIIEKNANFRVQGGRIVENDSALAQAMYYEPIPERPHALTSRVDGNDILAANRVISGATNLTESIDDYVNLHNSNTSLVHAAKTHIAYAILSREKRCPLMPPAEGSNISDLKKIDKSWMFDFFKLIAKPSHSTDPSDLFKNVSVINFNYDRCFEQFMVCAIQKFYNISFEASAQIVTKAEIIHPYGQVGDLKSIANNENSVAFGAVESRDVMRAAGLIKTYTEQVHSVTATKIKNIMNSSSRVVFLGFGFHKQNIELLSGPVISENQRNIYGTAIGISAPNMLEYAKGLRRIGGSTMPGHEMPTNIYLEPKLDCAGLIQSYREVLSS